MPSDDAFTKAKWDFFFYMYTIGLDKFVYKVYLTIIHRSGGG